MHIGVPCEVKSSEFRVGLVPASVPDLTAAGHDILVQSGAGARIGFLMPIMQQQAPALSAARRRPGPPKWWSR